MGTIIRDSKGNTIGIHSPIHTKNQTVVSIEAFRFASVMRDFPESLHLPF